MYLKNFAIFLYIIWCFTKSTASAAKKDEEPLFQIGSKELTLSDEKRQIFDQFKQNVADVKKPQHDDYYLVRWLKAREWNLTAAEEMLRKCLKHREVHQIDSLVNWELPELYKKYYPYGTSGFDKEQSPVVILLLNEGLDVIGLCKSATHTDLIKAVAKILDEILELGRKQSLIHGLQARQLTVIIDVKNFDISQFVFYRPAFDLAILMLQLYEANYPETLKMCFIINVPNVFLVAWKVVKQFLHPNTIAKIELLTSNKKNWTTKILEKISPDELPVYFGGTLTDPDGNPKCPSRITPGGKVPKSMYIDKTICENDVTYTTVVIKRRSKLELEYPITVDDSLLQWTFKTENCDIKFGVKKILEDGSEHEELPVELVKSKYSQFGNLTCKANTKYKLIFDNMDSLIKNKKLLYCAKVMPPLEKQEELEF